MIKKMLDENKLPKLLDAEQMKNILLEEEYGIVPDVDFTVTVSEPVVVYNRFCAMQAIHSYVDMTVTVEDRSHTFRVQRLLHHDGKKHPFFVSLSFDKDIPARGTPLEMIAEEGFSLFSVHYKDITSDDANFEDGLAGVLLPRGQETDTTAGKIAIWAWAAQRVLDYAHTFCDQLDLEQAAIIGHSRLGKTALVTALTDKRFRYAISNNSGCCGAALFRGNSGLSRTEGFKGGETISDIQKVFPYWFCKKFFTYSNDNLPANFDQHFLLASIAPRFVYAASASMDAWADPTSEFLSCVAASEAYERLGLVGFVHNDRLPEISESYHEGRIGHHLRLGAHMLSMHDWNWYMQYIKKHMSDKL